MKDRSRGVVSVSPSGTAKGQKRGRFILPVFFCTENGAGGCRGKWIAVQTYYNVSALGDYGLSASLAISRIRLLLDGNVPHRPACVLLGRPKTHAEKETQIVCLWSKTHAYGI